MCVIIHKPAGIGFEEQDAVNAYHNNSDGFGWMYYHPTQKQIFTGKSVEMKPEEIVNKINSLKEYDACFHYRFATHGAVTKENAHPFRVLSKKEDGIDLFFMHNGIISKAGYTQGQSDTEAFNLNFLRPILKEAPNLLSSETKAGEAFRKLIKDFIGSSKLCFMFGDGRVIKINEEQGHEFKSCWVSQKHAFTANSRSKNNPLTHQNHTWKKWWDDYDYTDTYQKPKTLFKGKRVKEGDTLWVFSNKDENFFAEGKVVSASTISTGVQFIGLNKVKKTLYFNNTTGLNYATGSEYTATHPNSLSGTGKKDEEEVGLKTICEISQKKSTTACPKNNEENNSEETSVSYKGILLDVEEGYGGDGVLVDAPYDYGDNDTTTIEELAELEPQDLLEFFCDNQKTAFIIFRDLLELTVRFAEEYEESFSIDLQGNSLVDSQEDDDEDLDEYAYYQHYLKRNY